MYIHGEACDECCLWQFHIKEGFLRYIAKVGGPTGDDIMSKSRGNMGINVHTMDIDANHVLENEHLLSGLVKDINQF